MEKPLFDLEKAYAEERVDLFQVEELEKRFEMKAWGDLHMNLVINGICEVYFPGPDHGSYYYNAQI
jgi:hypothetical protein